MRELFSFIFDRFTDPLGLPIETWKEWIILVVIEVAARNVAFQSVGDLYRSGAISGNAAGSFLHWTIRFGVFAAIWAVAYGVIAVGKFIIAHWVTILCVLGGSLLVATVIGILVIVRRKKTFSTSSNNAGERR